MSKPRKHIRTPHTLPLPRFARKVAALGPGDVLQLESGDVAEIARVIGKDKSAISRAIGSPELKASIASVVGVPTERIRLPGVGGWPKGRSRRADDGRAA